MKEIFFRVFKVVVIKLSKTKCMDYKNFPTYDFVK